MERTDVQLDDLDPLVLRESWSRFQALLEGLEHVPVQGYDDHRRVISWNRASTLVYGYTLEEALGQKLEDLIIPPAMRSEVVAGVDAWLAGGPPIPACELVLQDRWGREVPVYSSHVMHETATGQREMYCIDVDLRQLKRSESEREQLARERAELERQYRHAQRLESLGRLAGGVAHDFNNLLQVIGGYGTLAREDLAVDHPAHAALGHVLGAVERATQLVGQLLTFSRRQPLAPAVVDLEVLVTELLPMIQRLIGEDVRVSFEAAGGSPCVLGDRNLLEQMLMNLCVNARDAMPSGGEIALGVAIAPGPASSGRALAGADGDDRTTGPSHVLLTVRDDGCGMDADTRERIFEPFFTTKDAGTGTGLGLAMVHGLVEQHEGSIVCESQPGRGTTFHIRLPRCAAGR